jgi:hypothetical protein
MPKNRILRRILSSKEKINNYLNNDKVIVINDIAKQMHNRKIISVNFDEYMERKLNIKNMMHSAIICMICIIGALRMLFGAYITDPKIWVLIADPFYLIGDRVLISIAIAAVIIAIVNVRMICLSSKQK